MDKRVKPACDESWKGGSAIATVGMTLSDVPIHGGCLCGAVRYAVRGAPVRMLNCHCRDCQLANGAPFAALFVVARAALAITGAVRFHRQVGGSGRWIERGFCPACGSPVAIRLERAPDIIALQASSLDDPSVYRPEFEAFVASAQPWDVLAAGTVKFAGDWQSGSGVRNPHRGPLPEGEGVGER